MTSSQDTFPDASYKLWLTPKCYS